MSSLFTYIPPWFERLFKNYTWSVRTNTKEVFLTFDDGPTPEITEWVLEQLKNYNAKATFFCIGKNIAAHTDIFHKIIKDGHRIGNHTFDHLNGWDTPTKEYIKSIEKTEVELGVDGQKKLFRPPYGRIKKRQADLLIKDQFKIVMWNILSGDFDQSIAGEKCYLNTIKHLKKGAIIVFHDSKKASKNLKHVLPKVLETLKKEGYQCNTLN